MLVCDICGKKADRAEYCVRLTRDGLTYQNKKIDICCSCETKLEKQINMTRCKVLEDMLEEYEKTVEDLF